MKKTSKALLLGLCALLLVGASVLGTMAYLTAKTEQVVNTFTVGNVGIDLWESKLENGVLTSEHVKGNEYHLLPGETYPKNPTVEVADRSEDCYLFVKVENNIGALTITNTENGHKTIAQQMAANGWVAVEGAENVYVLHEKSIDGTVLSTRTVAKAHETFPVFSEFTIKGEATLKDLATKADGKVLVNEITINAYAIQKSGLSNTSDADLWDLAKPSV